MVLCLRDAQIVLDTNIVAAMLRSPEVPAALERSYQLRSRQSRCMVPIVVKAEILSLAARRRWNLSQEIEALLDGFTLVDISDPAVINAYVAIDNSMLGRKMSKNDLWVAAVTKSVNGTLLTTDGDFLHLHPAVITVEHILQQALFAGRVTSS